MDQIAQIERDLPEVNAQIQQAEKYLKFLKDAGEKTGDAENRLREMKLRRDRWVKAIAMQKGS